MRIHPRSYEANAHLAHNGTRLAELGEQGLVDLSGCLGNFSILAMLLNAFQVDRQDVPPPDPDVRGYAKIRDNAAGP